MNTIAEKGLVVFDVEVLGTPGHAASNNDNALYKAIPVMEDLTSLKTIHWKSK